MCGRLLRQTSPAPSLEALLYKAQSAGVLPITSVCDSGCVFCSNSFNPPSCEIFAIPPRSIQDIQDTLAWLQSAPGPIVIGESATRVKEGEPFTHPDFLKILELVRKEYPKKTIQVTTNACHLSPSITNQLQALDIELLVSLNTVGKRLEIMGDSDPKRTLENVEYLGGRLSFEGSIVALPFITGWDDLEETVLFLKNSGAEGIRILGPGFSRKHPLADSVTPSVWGEIRKFSVAQNDSLGIPVLFEPPGLRRWEARVDAVIPNSPAYAAGVRTGDLITRVSGKRVFSRKDCFAAVRSKENPQISLERDGITQELRLIKPRYASPGFIMYEDIGFQEWVSWENQAGFGRGVPLVLTSSLAKPLVESILEIRGLTAKVVAVKSRYFGGNIQAAGLLTVGDFIRAYSLLDLRQPPPTVSLPARAFDPWGRDLEGVSLRVFSETTKASVILAG